MTKRLDIDLGQAEELLKKAVEYCNKADLEGRVDDCALSGAHIDGVIASADTLNSNLQALAELIGKST